MLRNEMVRQGGLLFRWRSYLPLILVPVAVVAIVQSTGFDRWLGEMGEEAWVVFCFLLSIAGQTIRPLVVGFAPPGTSGRNTRAQRADVLNTFGAYSVCRHPLYLANFIVFVGILLAVQVWWLVLVGVLAYWVYYERIMAVEEAYLLDRFGRAFEQWAAATPAFWPAFRQWMPPRRPFSWRTVLRREPYGYFAIVVAFFAIEAASDLVIEGDPLAQWLHSDFIWPVQFVAGAIAFVVLRRLKTTNLL